MNEIFPRELEIAKDLARQAGQCIAAIRQRKDELQIQEKHSNNQFTSLVTTADLQANDIICNSLRALFPEYGILSEEMSVSNSSEDWWKKRYTWIIDPLDGTENFIHGGNDFGVHIGLTEWGAPVLGVNYYPSTDILYWAVQGQGAYKQAPQMPEARLLLHSSTDCPILPLHSKSDALMKTIYELLLQKPISEEECNLTFKYVGSTGLRLCLLAEGSYNLYVTKAAKAGLWDFLSGEVILKEAGGFISDWKGNALDYHNTNAQLVNGVVACGNEALYKRALTHLTTF